MAAAEAPLTWGGWYGERWFGGLEEDDKDGGREAAATQDSQESVEMMRARLRDISRAVQEKDSVLQDLQKRLKAALEEVEQGKAREAALRRRAEVAEAAEEALASQIGQLEAEAYFSIRERDRARQSRIEELQRRLEAVGQSADRRFRELEAEVEEGRAREASLLKRLRASKAGEDALSSQMVQLEAEAFARITQSQVDGRPMARRPVEHQVAQLETQLAEAQRALVAAHARLEETQQRRWVEEEAEAEAAAAAAAHVLTAAAAGVVKKRQEEKGKMGRISVIWCCVREKEDGDEEEDEQRQAGGMQILEKLRPWPASSLILASA